MLTCDGCGAKEVEESDIKAYKSLRKKELKIAVEKEFPAQIPSEPELAAWKKTWRREWTIKSIMSTFAHIYPSLLIDPKPKSDYADSEFEECEDCQYLACENCSVSFTRGTCFCSDGNFGCPYTEFEPEWYHGARGGVCYWTREELDRAREN